MIENKKIKNASPLEYDNINFKSKLEKMIYQTLKENNFPVLYESRKFILWEGFKPSIPFYNKDNKTRLLKLDNHKLINITYTPDFIFTYKGYFIIIEAKGIENDIYPLKKKLFRKLLESKFPNSIYFEIYNKRQLSQAIDIIKNLNKYRDKNANTEGIKSDFS